MLATGTGNPAADRRSGPERPDRPDHDPDDERADRDGHPNRRAGTRAAHDDDREEHQDRRHGKSSEAVNVSVNTRISSPNHHSSPTDKARTRFAGPHRGQR